MDVHVDGALLFVLGCHPAFGLALEIPATAAGMKSKDHATDYEEDCKQLIHSERAQELVCSKRARSSPSCSKHAISTASAQRTSFSSRRAGECGVCFPPWKRLLRTRRTASRALAVAVLPHRGRGCQPSSRICTYGGASFRYVIAASRFDPGSTASHLAASPSKRHQSGSARRAFGISKPISFSANSNREKTPKNSQTNSVGTRRPSNGERIFMVFPFERC